jgi:hypothetical protein
MLLGSFICKICFEGRVIKVEECIKDSTTVATKLLKKLLTLGLLRLKTDNYFRYVSRNTKHDLSSQSYKKILCFFSSALS